MKEADPKTRSVRGGSAKRTQCDLVELEIIESAACHEVKAFDDSFTVPKPVSLVE